MPFESTPKIVTEKFPDTKKLRLPLEERMQEILDNPKRLARMERYIQKEFTLDTLDSDRLLFLARALYESEKTIAIERGQGGQIEHLEASDGALLEKYKAAIFEKAEIQRRTLQAWLDYLKETTDYPLWFKYYVVRSLRTMGQFSRDDKTYSNRTDTTIAPFPELNSEALAFVQKALELQYDITTFEPTLDTVELTTEEHDHVMNALQSPATIATIIEREYTSKGKEATSDDIATIKARLQSLPVVEQALKGAKRNKRKQIFSQATEAHATTQQQSFADTLPLNPERQAALEAELISRLQTTDFAKLYAFAQVECAGNLDRESLQGEWVKYNQGSDYHQLEDSLKGKGTGWCTAEGSAAGQLENGDFYVFYTKNKAGIPTEPRIAIRMSGGEIGEIRGVNPRQELEPELVETAREKYQDLPGAEKYAKADKDMKQMTTIHQKCFSVDPKTKDKTSLNPTLTSAELRFLYEIDGKMQSFGYDKDPRVEEVLATRRAKADLAGLYDCIEDQISITKEEALLGDIVFHHGGLNLSDLTSAEGLTLPKTVGGDLYLYNLTSAEKKELCMQHPHLKIH